MTTTRAQTACEPHNEGEEENGQDYYSQFCGSCQGYYSDTLNQCPNCQVPFQDPLQKKKMAMAFTNTGEFKTRDPHKDIYLPDNMLQGFDSGLLRLEPNRHPDTEDPPNVLLKTYFHKVHNTNCLLFDLNNLEEQIMDTMQKANTTNITNIKQLLKNLINYGNTYDVLLSLIKDNIKYVELGEPYVRRQDKCTLVEVDTSSPWV